MAPIKGGNVSIQGPKLKAVRIPHGLCTEFVHCVVICLCTYSLVASYIYMPDCMTTCISLCTVWVYYIILDVCVVFIYLFI